MDIFLTGGVLGFACKTEAEFKTIINLTILVNARISQFPQNKTFKISHIDGDSEIKMIAMPIHEYSVFVVSFLEESIKHLERNGVSSSGLRVMLADVLRRLASK